MTDVVILPADNPKLVEIIGDAIGDVEVTHAGGSGAGAIGADNFNGCTGYWCGYADQGRWSEL